MKPVSEDLDKAKVGGENIEKEEPEKPEDITIVTKTITDFITKKPKNKGNCNKK